MVSSFNSFDSFEISDNHSDKFFDGMLPLELTTNQAAILHDINFINPNDFIGMTYDVSGALFGENIFHPSNYSNIEVRVVYEHQIFEPSDYNASRLTIILDDGNQIIDSAFG